MKWLVRCVCGYPLTACCVLIGVILTYRIAQTPSGNESVGVQMEDIRGSLLCYQPDHVPDLPVLPDDVRSPPSPP